MTTNNGRSEHGRMLQLQSLCMVLLLLLSLVAATASLPINETAVEPSSRTSSNSSSTVPSWEADLFHLPANVPFPGSEWLKRIAASDTVFVYNGTRYSSVYAAFFHNSPTTLDMPCRNLNAWLNSIFIPPTVAARLVVWTGSIEGTHYLLCYLRNFVGAMIVYYGTASIFHYFCYMHSSSSKVFEEQKRPRPSPHTMWDQIKLAQASMILYVCLPLLDEYIIEQGYTRVYYTVQEIGGWRMYAISMILYFALVEIGIYWMHRTLHTNKWLYRHVHLLHHKYNKPETLTPWASIAFHPLDGILQASPYVAALPLVPCHYLTHFALLFFTAIWATYIHDAMDFNVGHIMGSKYHTVHHTHYIYNYGQVFTFCDRIWGTFQEPAGPTGCNHGSSSNHHHRNRSSTDTKKVK